MKWLGLQAEQAEMLVSKICALLYYEDISTTHHYFALEIVQQQHLLLSIGQKMKLKIPGSQKQISMV